MSRFTLLGLSLLTLSGCAVDDFELTVANPGPAGDAMGGFLYLRTNGGNPDRPNNDDTVEVETRTGGGAWEPAQWVELEWVTPPLVDVVLVADNSGSERDYVEEIRDAVSHFSHTMLVRQPEDRMGLVRVSTVSEQWVPLTYEKEEIQDAAAGLFVNRGWTALWDGVRLANETLAERALQPSDTGLCMDRAFRSVVVFTDGQDNNSSGEHATSYEDDGIDTTLDDLLDMHVYGAKTVVHTVGVGNDVDYDALETLSAATGGQTKAIRNFMGLQGALRGTAAQLEHHMPFCFQPARCSDTEARVMLTRANNRGEPQTRSFDIAISPTCID